LITGLSKIIHLAKRFILPKKDVVCADNINIDYGGTLESIPYEKFTQS